jgi:hypothetical protein
MSHRGDNLGIWNDGADLLYFIGRFNDDQDSPVVSYPVSAGDSIHFHYRNRVFINCHKLVRDNDRHGSCHRLRAAFTTCQSGNPVPDLPGQKDMAKTAAACNQDTLTERGGSSPLNLVQETRLRAYVSLRRTDASNGNADRDTDHNGSGQHLTGLL